MSSNVLSISGVSKSHDGRPLIEAVSLGVDTGDKIGIIGPNGAGKSTLLRIIAGTEAADDGTVAVRKGTRLAFLEQIPDLHRHDTVREALEDAVGELRDCIAEYEIAAAAMRDDAPDLLERIEQLGGWDYQHRVEAAAHQLGLDNLDAPIDQLSGGERKRVALARLFLQEPELLLLDEPTNHLDAQMVDWLQGWLTRSRATVVLVTHDRYFLDDVVERMVELRDGALKSYVGNYTDFLAARAIEEALRERTRHRQLRTLMTELEWAKRSPKARTTKSSARLQRIDQAQEEVERLTGKEFVADFRFGKPPRLGGDVLKLDGLHMRYGDGPELIAGLTLQMRRGERIGILGPNGCGKSTLLELVIGELKPTSGEVVVGHNTRIAYFDQQREALDPQQTVRETLTDGGGDLVYPGSSATGIHVASWLDRFGFVTATHNRTVSTLSGGERNRLAIARFLLKDANLLILDEPTNDLDIPTLNMLEEAIVGFDGCVIVVSHDRYLLDKVTSGILAFEQEYRGPGAVMFMPGNYSHYFDQRLLGLRAEKLAADQERAGADRRAKAPGRAKVKGNKGLTYRERQELDGMEAAIETAEGNLAELSAKLADPKMWSDGPAQGRAMQDELAQAQATAAQLYTRWEDLLARVEEDTSGGGL